MMTLQQNKQKMFYALQVGQIPIYETDENGNVIYYTDNEGNQIPLETGETEIGYTDAIQFFGNISYCLSLRALFGIFVYRYQRGHFHIWEKKMPILLIRQSEIENEKMMSTFFIINLDIFINI